MSGGHFDYGQYKINEIAEHVESLIERNGKEIPKDELRSIHSEEWLKKYPEDRYYYKYPDEVIEEFKKGLEILKKAYIYAQRIDWLVSGDDGEESFLKRLDKELKNQNYESRKH